jgi:hypothetical protein
LIFNTALVVGTRFAAVTAGLSGRVARRAGWAIAAINRAAIVWTGVVLACINVANEVPAAGRLDVPDAELDTGNIVAVFKLHHVQVTRL